MVRRTDQQRSEATRILVRGCQYHIWVDLLKTGIAIRDYKGFFCGGPCSVTHRSHNERSAQEVNEAPVWSGYLFVVFLKTALTNADVLTERPSMFRCPVLYSSSAALHTCCLVDLSGGIAWAVFESLCILNSGNKRLLRRFRVMADMLNFYCSIIVETNRSSHGSGRDKITNET